MGLFKMFDYNREGPGVYANGPQYGPFKTFFAILGRKFWKIIQLNLLFVLFSLPAIALALVIGTYVFQQIFPFMQLEALEKLLTSFKESLALTQIVTDFDPAQMAATIFLDLNIVLALAIVGLQLVVVGPVQAGVTYLFRNFVKEEPSFLWFDFKEQAKSNLKQSLLSGLIGIVGFIILCINIWYYSSGQIFSNEIVNGVITVVFVTMLVIFLMMQMYVYPMMVTFKLRLRDIYKNAFFLSIAKLPSNLGILLLSLVFVFVIPIVLVIFMSTLGIMIALLYFLFLGYGISLLLTNFQVYRQMKKYMIDPYLRAQKENQEIDGTGSEEEGIEPIFKDTQTRIEKKHR